jgi:hypothetical protein
MKPYLQDVCSFNVEDLTEGEEQQVGCLLWRSHHEHLIYANMEVVFFKQVPVSHAVTHHTFHQYVHSHAFLQPTNPITCTLPRSSVICFFFVRSKQNECIRYTYFLSLWMFRLRNHIEYLNKNFLEDLFQTTSGVQLCFMSVKRNMHSSQMELNKT